MMKTLLTSVALLFAVTATSFATAPVGDVTQGVKAKTDFDDLEAKRRKKRIPGGSGCDDPGDAAEHPECRT